MSYRVSSRAAAVEPFLAMEVADHNINVIDMVNLSRGDFAYSIIDVENQPGSGVMSAINSAEHVIRARLLSPVCGKGA